MENLIKYIDEQLKALKIYEEALKEMYSNNSKYYSDLKVCRAQTEIYKEILKKLGDEKNEIKNVRN